MESNHTILPAAPATGRDLRAVADLPGPPGWPVLGNLPQMRVERIHRDVEDWTRQFGPLFKLRFGPLPVLVVAGHEAVNAILRDRPDGFRRPRVTANVTAELGGKPGLFMAEGQAWRDQRRMVMAGFAPHAIKAYFPALVTVARRLQRRWQDAAGAGRVIDLMGDLKRYTVDIIAGLAFGAEVNTIDGGEDVIQRHLDRILPAVARRSIAWFPHWRYIKLPADRRLDRSIAGMNHEIATLIAAARARMAAEPARRARPVNLLEAMIAAADEGGSGVDDDAVAGNVMTMLLAGEDTTANTLAWMLYLLHRHPAALRRAQEEVRRLAPDPAGFTVEQMDGLEYLDACIQEAMRLKPVAPYIPLEALRDTVVGDVAVPRGMLVWCVLRHDAVDEGHVPRAAAFEPERWLAGGGQAMDKRLGQPFGGGLRTCPGRYLALLEIKAAMAMLLSTFELAAVDTPDGGEARELMGFVMSPLGLTMRLRPRAAS
ncbi:cytochrome P450 [Rugamonas sp.]|uniref:cytochrome P450 n=1 Tax=Rugamonas sp. TaxID=1926287 RepID=UPI0025F0C249|nr:cytochrome P450 [Rugamonas sp.]